MSTHHQLAEVNVARLRAPLGTPAMAGLVRALGDVNWLAEQRQGFVWRLRGEDAPVTYGRLVGEAGMDVVVTLSVWQSYEALHQYVFRSAHALFMQRRARWFKPIGGFTTALWWVPAGAEPPAAEGLERLQHLRTHGPSPRAFSVRQQFDADGKPVRRDAQVVISKTGGI